MDERIYDIAVIGGGINGCGIARDAAGRGLSVILAESRDLASGTSSASTKLIHGGLRYLEHYDFGLVRHSLREREVLLRMAPHIAWPMRFVLPHHAGLRPAWLIRIGLFLYDHLGGRELLPASRTVDLRTHAAGRPLKPEFVRAFEYSDCWVDDARLVVLTARDAARLGAEIRVRTQMTSAQREDGLWRVTLSAADGSGETESVLARSLVNAGGPWVADILNSRIRANAQASVRLVKGSHIVVPRLFDHDRAYIFQNSDGRIVFAIPYEDDFTLIGTTDVDFDGDPSDVAISDDEVTYLCEAVNDYFARSIGPADVVHTYSGVRPLYDEEGKDAKDVTRDYVLELSPESAGAALLSVFGGKITTFRHLAEEALEKLGSRLPGHGAPWTRGSHLPGGDMEVGADHLLAEELDRTFPDLGPAAIRRLVRTYGTEASAVADAIADMPREFGGGLTEGEARWLMENEWARTAEDVAWRRTKLGLRMSGQDIASLDHWMGDQRPG